MEAVEKVKEHHENGKDYFAVILDWKKPFIDGIETIKQIRRFIGSDITIIIISAYDWSEIELEAKTAGVDLFTIKLLFKSRLIHLFYKIISGNSKKIQSKNEVEEIKQEDFSGIRILLAEDNYLIFMDVQMPVMNGNEASSAIRSLSRKDAYIIPIIAMSANAFSDDVQASLNAGMNGHISKPLDLNQLFKTLKKWLKK